MANIDSILKQYFQKPQDPSQKKYEALRAFYVDGIDPKKISNNFGYSPAYFKKLRFYFYTQINQNINPFFYPKKKGPKKRSTDSEAIEQIIQLRKQNHSINDIKAVLDAKGQNLSLETIDNILKDQGFAPLPRRTRKERNSIAIPKKIQPPICQPIFLPGVAGMKEMVDEEFASERGGGVLIFLPLIQKLGIIQAIEKSNFPQTSVINAVSSVMSFLALKLLGRERLSHDETWNLDRALGLFAGLNVLPKNSTLSSYSYRVYRSHNQRLLAELNNIFKDTELEEGEFNLDFKAIPHWGDASVLEKNWSGSRSRAIKSLLALIVQEPATGFLSYTNAEIKHCNQSNAAIEFVDFWIEGRGICPKMLIFDSRFTTYYHLNQLNKSEQRIKFLTLRRRGKNLRKEVENIPEDDWLKMSIEIKTKDNKRKFKTIKVYESYVKLRNYEGEVRQFIITDHGRPQPTFMITNDFVSNRSTLIKKYARRWLVEQEIAELIKFFHLNQTSSSIVVKVDFDLTMSLLAHNLYQVLTRHLPGFERCTAYTIYRNFIENGAKVAIIGDDIVVALKKKTHLPILFELPWMREKTYIAWLDRNIKFITDTVS